MTDFIIINYKVLYIKKKHKTELKTSLTMELLGCVLCFDQSQYLDKISQVENIENNLITLILGTTNKHGGDCIS